jgi:hypothetical protein
MRKLLIGLTAAALLVAGVLMALATPPHCPVSRAASERIEPGMSQGQVHAALGVPPGDYRTGPRPYYFTSGGGGFFSGHFRRIEFWYGDEGDVVVQYDTDSAGRETVTLVTFEPSGADRPTPLDVLRWRLGRLKQRLLR